MNITRNGVDYKLINQDLIEVTKNGEKLGDIFINSGDWDSIVNGADPIDEGWEDGIGHVLTGDGWGEFAND